MPFSRYSGTRIIRNNNDLYDEFLDKKNLRSIRQYVSPSFVRLEESAKDSIPQIIHTWTLGDRYYKLAFEHYGDPRYWWVIAFFNNKPTEAHVKNGDQIRIPIPYEDVILLYGV